jgi:hypothetical protein
MQPDDGWVFDVESARVVTAAKGDNISGAGASLANIVVRTPQRICFELIVRPSLLESTAYISAYLEATETRPLVRTSYQVCVGDPEGKCPGRGTNLSCGASVDQWARQMCASPFSVSRVSATSGGRCGYSLYQVTCSGAN